MTATGVYNTGFGSNSLTSLTSGARNTAIGYFSQNNVSTGADNVSIGKSTLSVNYTGSQNTAIGEYALGNGSAISGNVAIGYAAGLNETGSNNFYVGNVLQSSSANDKAYSLLYGTFSGTAGSLTGQMLDVNGLLGVGTTTPSSLLSLAGTH